MRRRGVEAARRWGGPLSVAAWTAAWTAACWFSGVASLAAQEIDFAHDIVPIFKQHCASCHAGSQQKGNFSINSRESLLKGGESGAAVVPGKAAESDLVSRLATDDETLRMPPEGPRVPAEKVALLKRWIDAGAPWQEGFQFGPRAYDPPLKPRRPDLPAPVAGRDHPLDRLLDHVLARRGVAPLPIIDDATFARRVHLDLVGLLPEPEALAAFVADASPDKRTRLVRELLADDVAYAEHWLTFWNDLLRNDYTGTGFITGGRKQITSWLYRALVDNKPYDQFVRELIAPSPESEGFGAGIRWRGDVSAGQTVEIQFAQSVGQAFLGINLKCASCHDSFIDRWTLQDSYGLAAIYAQQPLELHRCDKPLGKKATPAWLFPELGKVDAASPQPERLKQLAALMTHPDNGRFTRTIVNRLWHRLMGRGIVHPTDAMQTAPWNADLLDFLAVHLADQKYDLKKTLELIATSQSYQAAAQSVSTDADDHGYLYAGPRAKRMTAEQFVDAVWQLTGAAPARFDAQVVRGKPPAGTADAPTIAGRWIWSTDGTGSPPPPSDQTATFRRVFKLKSAPQRATAVVTADNSYTLFVNGKRSGADDNWETVEIVPLQAALKAGDNEILIVAKNGGQGPNPAGLFFEARWVLPDGQQQSIASDENWEWTRATPNGAGKFGKDAPRDWQKAVAASRPETWSTRVAGEVAAGLQLAGQGRMPMVRSSLVKNDFLMRALGRPHREQIVSVRPLELTTLEAIDLNNGQILANYLEQGGKNLAGRSWQSSDQLVDWLFRSALSRSPSAEERALGVELLGEKPTAQAIEDLLWSIAMLPEFQLVR